MQPTHTFAVQRDDVVDNQTELVRSFVEGVGVLNGEPLRRRALLEELAEDMLGVSVAWASALFRLPVLGEWVVADLCRAMPGRAGGERVRVARTSVVLNTFTTPRVQTSPALGVESEGAEGQGALADEAGFHGRILKNFRDRCEL